MPFGEISRPCTCEVSRRARFLAVPASRFCCPQGVRRQNRGVARLTLRTLCRRLLWLKRDPTSGSALEVNTTCRHVLRLLRPGPSQGCFVMAESCRRIRAPTRSAIRAAARAEQAGHVRAPHREGTKWLLWQLRQAILTPAAPQFRSPLTLLIQVSVSPHSSNAPANLRRYAYIQGGSGDSGLFGAGCLWVSREVVRVGVILSAVWIAAVDTRTSARWNEVKGRYSTQALAGFARWCAGD